MIDWQNIMCNFEIFGSIPGKLRKKWHWNTVETEAISGSQDVIEGATTTTSINVAA